jgi:hypothetical protein
LILTNSGEKAMKARFLTLALSGTLLASAWAATADCGPFTDVTAFCAPILELYFLGVANGNSATTFAPDQPATRGETAAFVARAFNQSSARSSRRAALGQWWTTMPRWGVGLGVTSVDSLARLVACDGADVWVTGGSVVSRVRASDGALLGTWTAAQNGFGILAAMGRIFAVGDSGAAASVDAAPPGNLYEIDPTQPAGTVTVVANVGSSPHTLAFDGARIWTANGDNLQGSTISIVTPGTSLPWQVQTVSAGFSSLFGILYDGHNIWTTDVVAGDLLKLDANGAVIQRVHTGAPQLPVFDGSNIWVPVGGGSASSLVVVRISDGAILKTLTGNGLQNPYSAAFDGMRILVTNAQGDSVSLWNAADLAPIGTFSAGAGSLPRGACSDGLNFWVALNGTRQIARF